MSDDLPMLRALLEEEKEKAERYRLASIKADCQLANLRHELEVLEGDKQELIRVASELVAVIRVNALRAKIDITPEMVDSVVNPYLERIRKIENLNACPICKSTDDPYFSRVVPMGYFCTDCGHER